MTGVQSGWCAYTFACDKIWSGARLISFDRGGSLGSVPPLVALSAGNGYLYASTASRYLLGMRGRRRKAAHHACGASEESVVTSERPPLDVRAGILASLASPTATTYGSYPCYCYCYCCSRREHLGRCDAVTR